jgi:hypothetical protein
MIVVLSTSKSCHVVEGALGYDLPDLKVLELID